MFRREVSQAVVIQMEEISEVRPNTAMHPEFGIALEEAKDAGVEVNQEMRTKQQ